LGIVLDGIRQIALSEKKGKVYWETAAQAPFQAPEAPLVCDISFTPRPGGLVDF
jgi:hypothetical protein